MDIRTLQRTIVDALEDVKAQEIQVFDTTHLTGLFDRVVVASGTSNRQTRALAMSVRDKVKQAGGDVISIEGLDNGEWVLVDCADAVVHIMQPLVRGYYSLEELWGDKLLPLHPPARKTAARKSAATPNEDAALAATTPARKAPARKTPARKTAGKAAGASAAKPAAKRATKTAGKPASKSPAKSAAKPTAKVAGKPAAKPAAKRTPATKTPKSAKTGSGR